MEIYRGREIETEQLNDGKWIVCAQDNNGVKAVARPGWHYVTEEDGTGSKRDSHSRSGCNC
jgi:hypothetical protein